MTRRIVPSVRIVRCDDLDERAERRAYWATRTIEERVLEVESLRRMWPELFGDPDQPIARVVNKRRLGEPAPTPPREAIIPKR
jgi:hypothetical protein